MQRNTNSDTFTPHSPFFFSIVVLINRFISKIAGPLESIARIREFAQLGVIIPYQLSSVSIYIYIYMYRISMTSLYPNSL